MEETPQPVSPSPNSDEPIVPPRPGEVLSPGMSSPLPSPKKSKKKSLLIVFLIIILVAAAVAGYLFFFRNKATAPTTSSTTTTPAETPKVVTHSIIYTTQDTDSSGNNEPAKLFSLATDGSGEAKLLYTLNHKTNNVYDSIGISDVSGQSIVFDINGSIMASQDGGKTFNAIYKYNANDDKNQQAITSLKLISGGKKLIIAHLTSLAEGKVTNVIKEMDLDGKNSKILNTFETAGVFIYNYNPTSQQLVYALGCYFCDGGPSFPRMIDLKTDKDKQLFNISSNNLIYNPGVTNSDGSKYIYYTGTSDPQVAEQFAGVGWQGAPPYKVIEYDINTGNSSVLATIGTLHEKDTNGKFKEYLPVVGYTNDTQKAYYTIDKNVFVISSKPTLAFEADNIIDSLPYISANEIIAGASKVISDAQGEYFIYRMDIPANKTLTLLQTKSFYSILGVTSK